jgi:hypothetical protein
MLDSVITEQLPKNWWKASLSANHIEHAKAN